MSRHLLPALLVAFVVNAAWAVENNSQSFRVLRAEEKTRDRVVYWVVNTPLYHEDRYFEVEVQVGDVKLVGEYEPRHDWEMLPEDWKSGVFVKGRLERHSFYLQRPNGTYLKFVIVKRSRIPAAR